MLADRQSQTHSHGHGHYNTLLPYWGQSNKVENMNHREVYVHQVCPPKGAPFQRGIWALISTWFLGLL